MSEYKHMSTWEIMAHLLKKLEWENDLAYDCLMQILSEELGDKEMQRLHRKASERFASISKTPTQPQSAQEEREGRVQYQDYWRDN